MGWKQAAFGTGQPTREQWIGTSAAVAVLILVFAGIFVDFAPAPVLRGIHMAVIFLIVGVIETALLFAHASRKGRMGQFVDRGLLRFLFLLLAIPLMLGFVSWLIAIKTLPWTYTRVFGREVSEIHMMETRYSRSRRSCDHRLYGGPMEGAFPAYLCVREAFYDRHPNQQVEVVLAGRRSALGFSIQHVYSQD
ncbi:hypothetical protein [Pseudoxanthomonas sp. z9]|uniref:hypothetical protein n=1 Tax=Pseudoxanthomonas sp. z9 TaxID=2584942 RepID=UPI0011434123|nr:hypothetical protein [Pseudoxanthomonas sp. z9]